MENKYHALINSTPVEGVPARLFDLCKQASVVKEFVVGVSECCLAWKTRVNPGFLVRAMADAYIQRVVSPQGKLGIMYIFNDIVQKDPASFAVVGFRHFLRIIAPSVGQLPDPIKQAHTRVLLVLQQRNIYTAAQVNQIKKTFNLDHNEQQQKLLSVLEVTDDQQRLRRAFTISDPTEKGLIQAAAKATTLLCSDPKTSEDAINWATVLLNTAGLSIDSPIETFKGRKIPGAHNLELISGNTHANDTL
ncbi:hypothetical protein GNI_155780 [Gregarina niphandrodes]|uniref:CID domain-containing protein n=1 Tax=Gregarina niphandrodes TaxID=110365 RepID=A0A023AZK8_GRENI|nr:hypothetical protein GNI_155780 [Gregarina niphandrodes]EZG43936.1 hypothetical protein GNI_155780 [Gregarina niphandrodes]|eukprot:XP_011132907.1 hypothetical protein GNI_155780 [Gregarina niphandrodes]